MKKWSKIIGTLALLAAIAFPAGSARANTAAGVTITNQATLTYNGGVTATSPQVVVTVALRPSNPNITISGGTGTYTAANSPGITQTVIITATANGPTDYTVSVAAGTQTNNSNSGGANTATPYNAASPTSKTVTVLAATVTTAGSTVNYLMVPKTVGASTSNVNGFTAGATVFYTSPLGNPIAVTLSNTTPITDNGDGVNMRLNFAAPLSNAGDVAGAGFVIGERRQVTFYAYPGSVVTSSTPITVDVNATATNNSLNITTATPAANSWTTTAPTVSFNKYVRNFSDATVTGTGTAYSYNSKNYYPGGVTAKPGEVLEYIIVATNTDATNPLTGVSISDALPVGSYASFVYNAFSATLGANSDITYVNGASSPVGLQTHASGTFQAILSAAGNLNVKVGTGATDTTAGDIPIGANGTVKILYQLTIN